MSDKPPAVIPGHIKLTSGDRLPVAAFWAGFDKDGYNRYVIKLEDGSPISVKYEDWAGAYLEQVPGKSTMEFEIDETPR